MAPRSFNSSFSPSPGFRVGVSVERRAELERTNRLKQERYVKQKTIQFSNLLERAGDQIGEYVESQRNLFIVENAPSPSDGDSNVAPSDALDGAENADLDASTADADFDSPSLADDRRDDDVDEFFDPADDVFFAQKPFYRYDRSNATQEEFAFDPTARSSTTLRDHLLEQLRLDGRCADLSPLVRTFCEKIVDRLDSNGYLTVDAAAPSPLTESEYSELRSKFEAIFDVDATPETLDAARDALAELKNAASKSARDAARRRFDAAVGRKTTADERERFQTTLDSVVAPTSENGDADDATLDPLDALFPKKPSRKERDAAEKALAVVQSLDPPGVGARSLQESLLLRVRDDVPDADALRRIIAEAFDDFQKKRVSAIAEKTGIPFATVAAIYDAGFPFHPAPASLFADESPTRLIRPEIFLEKSPSGRWRARLDDERPEFRVDPLYRKMLLAKNVDKTTKDYLRRQYVDATALLDALQSRDSTVLRVAQAAVDFQNDYFDDETATARPLTLRQVADKIGLDPSTVSRACVDKWLATPRGFVALKSLFPKAVSGDVASASVESRIRELIDGEEKSRPLSDDALADELRRRFQIAVSRKTVQEYRERLQIPNSRARKRLFQEQNRKPEKRRSRDL
ncbi:MAG: hypothetical protein IJO40_08320 [Thermoguttaceae bacterium]|nr:hypothetical protein [Thermoguttaceae bacterium]